MKFDQAKIRQHLVKCFKNKQFTPFPHTVEPSPFLQSFFPAHSIELFCDCELPEAYDNMVECEKCEKWFHLTCVGLKSIPPPQKEWLCKVCEHSVQLRPGLPEFLTIFTCRFWSSSPVKKGTRELLFDIIV